MKHLLMFPKDREAKTKQSNIIYWYKCGRSECDEEYIGESARTIFVHENITGHKTILENFKIIAREGQNMARAIKGLTSESTILPSTETLENTACHTSGIKFCFENN